MRLFVGLRKGKVFTTSRQEKHNLLINRGGQCQPYNRSRPGKAEEMLNILP
jgi:hypothetical protein